MKQKDAKCSYELEREIKTTLLLKCRECGCASTLNDKHCLKNVLEILVDESGVNNIVLSNFTEKQYHSDAVELLKLMVAIINEMEHAIIRDPMAEFDGYAANEKQPKPNCVKCELHPKKLFKELRNLFMEDADELYLEISRISDIVKDKSDVAQTICKKCRSTTLDDIVHLNAMLSKLESFVAYKGFSVVVSKDALLKLGNKDEKKSSVLTRGIERIFEKSQNVRPCFSSSWVSLDIPERAETIKEYPIGKSRVRLINIENSTETLYHVTPYEYTLSQHYIKLVELAKMKLVEKCPKSIKFNRLEQARNYVIKEGNGIIYRLSKEHGIRLGNNRLQEIDTIKELSEILARYTTGLGVIETPLLDRYVQDIYIDAPTSENTVYLTIGGISDQRIYGKCITNICLDNQDAESLVSRFKHESGRPFSEAMPVLEVDMGAYNTRITAIGKPLSPGGYAFALRKHSYDPWTLLRFIACKSITPLAAGLISFLVDGQSTILVAGSRGAGKSSLLGAILLEFPQSQRILTIEDTLELPTEEMQRLDYKVQSMYVKSAIGGTGGISMDDALRVSLRLGESAIVLGEVRGLEAKTLYEAMRTGTAGSSVLGTIHGNSAKAVYERVVHDMGIPSKSFGATDIIIIAGLTRPGGSQRQMRRVVQVTELLKEAKVDGTFQDMLHYDEKADALVESKSLRDSEKIQRIAKSWGFSVEEAIQNIYLRAAYREKMVKYAIENNKDELLSAKWVNLSNNAYWQMMEQNREKGIDYQEILKKWSAWFEKSVKYA